MTGSGRGEGEGAGAGKVEEEGLSKAKAVTEEQEMTAKTVNEVDDILALLSLHPGSNASLQYSGTLVEAGNGAKFSREVH
jgi:hypothetical protein